MIKDVKAFTEVWTLAGSQSMILRKKIYLIRLFTWGQGLIRPASFSFFFLFFLSFCTTPSDIRGGRREHKY